MTNLFIPRMKGWVFILGNQSVYQHIYRVEKIMRVDYSHRMQRKHLTNLVSIHDKSAQQIRNRISAI